MPTPLRDVPEEGIELIKSFEGIPDGDPSTVNIDPYLDPVGIWTIGWGHAITSKNGFLRGAQNKATARSLFPGGITLAQAQTLLHGDLLDTAAAVSRLAQVALDDGQYAALISFAFNAGTGALGQSTLLRKLNAGDAAGAADQFLVWNKGRKNGVLVELPGLTRRRRAERAMFLGLDWRDAAAAGISRGLEAPKRARRSKPRAKIRVKPAGRLAPPGASPQAKPAKAPGAAKSSSTLGRRLAPTVMRPGRALKP